MPEDKTYADVPLVVQSDRRAAPDDMPAAELGGWRQTFRALRHRNFRLFCFGQIVSLCGTWMQSVAQNWLLYRITHSEFLVGLNYFCLQIPVFALGPLGGLAADRLSRHRIIVVCQTLLMVQALALWLLVFTGHGQVKWQYVMVLALAQGCINAFDMPGRQSFVIEMTGREDLLNAISLNSSLFNAARVLGPAIAGVLVYRLGEALCFLINGLSFAPVIIALLMMRLPPFRPPESISPWEHLLEGYRYAYRTLHLRYLLLLLSANTLAGMGALVLMPFFADAILGRGSRGLGILLAAMGVGALIGTLVLASRGTQRGLARVILLGAGGLGVSLILLAISRNFYFSIAVMVLLGFSTLRQLAATNTLIQTVIPDQYRGRIMSLYTMTVVGLGPFGSLATGALAARAGAPLAVAVGGVLSLAAALLFRSRLAIFERSIQQETPA
jgi:MFS family permease